MAPTRNPTPPRFGVTGEMGHVDSWATLALAASSDSGAKAPSRQAAPSSTPSQDPLAAVEVAGPPAVLPVIQPAVACPPDVAATSSRSANSRWTPETAVHKALMRLSDCPPWGGVALT
ncbi:hypothetical protein BU14_0293s0010 [Porphyra umbilicalis]|uniref:Uncharacterized protein n=1 Tax=Porphyra umbilicalis TaxID=2786 RepID=A0A1X6P0E1_PORUM|nr:hypothetical protein BU14_0293s0010 [Porphyra umbilicalis]|eukprot:OSX74339.1 hypothetical protein BU14_0293s0010 [Porphyra umbilicalis]